MRLLRRGSGPVRLGPRDPKNKPTKLRRGK
jgi:hypothetical protein